MKNIAVKVHNTNKTVQQAQVVTQDGQPTVIQAQKGVNYEFLDQATGRAPHHIITKREGNDLHVSFEENGKEADLIIEDFYSYPDSGLIGLAENGQYYNYIPDTGSVQDYVTQLNVGDVEGQALGGEGFPAPWWVAGNADMNVFPWLLGLGAIGAIAAIVSDDDDNNNNVTPTPNTVILSNLSVANLSDGSNNVQITGKVQINSEDARAGTTVDITLPNGKIVPATVGDNGQYSVILSDAESLNALKQGPKVTASKDNVTDIFNLTPAPKIDPVSKQDTTVTGTAEPNSEVTVKGKAGKELGKATTDANGKWSLPVPAGTELTSGEDLTATATKAGSNPSLRDDEIVTPPKPTINPVDETSPISGTAEPNQKVEVTLPNGTTASTVSDDKGNWIVPNPGLNKGDKITAEAVVSVDGKDIKSEPQPENVIDNTPPSEPQINPVKDGDTTVSGTAEPNSKVTLTDKDGNKIGETTADDKGNWTTKVTTPLKEGDEVKATATDASGNPSQPAEQLVVDTNAPNAPDIKPIADDNKPISGTAEPNSTVTVTFPDGKTATTKADDKGNWSVPNPGLNPGDKVTATATDANGNESPKANGSVNDTTPPQQPVINGVKESDDTVTGTAEPNSTVTVTFPNGTTATVNADKDGKWSVPADPSVKDGGKITATARDNAGNTSEKAEEPIVDDLAPPAPSVNPITEGNPITGTAQPNTTITIKDKDGNTIGTATTDDKGNWSVPAHPNVKTGDEVTATATDQAGNTSSPTKEVVIDDKAPSEPSINPIKDGDTTITGTAEPNSTVNIDTNGDGTPDKTVKADDKGNFTATVDTPLKAGDKVTATATDKAGNTSKPAKEPVVDTTAPNQPDILPIDGDNKDAPIKGTAEPNSTVTVTFPDGKTATTKADDKGNWELPNPGLNTGDKVTATAKDNSGKESSPAEAVVNGDITPPAKPTVNVSDDGKTITGTAEPNSTVEIDTNGDGQPDITTKADENGNYTAPLDKPLTNGETVTARAKDPAGNISAPATDTAPDTQPTETAINDKGDTVTVTGAKPGDTVTVKDPATGETIGTGTVGNDGKATITLDKPITNGETVPVTVGTEDKPVTAPDTVPTNTSINPTGDTVTVTGAKPGDTVTVKDPATGETIGTGTVGDDGKATINLDKPITDGSTIPVTVGEENKPVVAPDASDKTAPNAPTTAPDMTPETDTGAKNDDNITKNDKPSFVVPAPQEGETPVLLVDGKEVPAEFDPNTNTLTPKQPIEPGKHKVTTAVKDPAGNVSDPSPELAIEIDKTAPNAPTTAPDMTPETDTGAKNDDNITKNDKPSFVVPAPQEGETPVLLVDGKEVPADFDPNTNTLTPKQPIEPGKHKVTTAVKDPAGNVSDPSPELAIEIDKIAPNAPTTAPDMTPETDTGAKNDDNITKNDKPSFVVPAPQEGETPVLLVDGKEVPADFDPNTNTLTPKQPIEPGKHKVTTAVKDPAGNVSDPSPELAIEIDKTAPNAPTTAPDMTPETDTGAKNDDNITKNDKPSFVVPAPQEGETPVLLVDGKEVPADFDPNTNTLTPKQPIEPGKHKVTTAVKDPAGNVSDPSPELAIEIDKIAPNAPTTAPDMTPETDTGAKNDDNITKNDKPSFVVPAPQEGETPVLLVDGKEVPAEFDPNTNTLTPKQPIEPGKHKVTTAVKDPAGNVSDPSPELAIEIDKTAPNAPTTAPDMTPETDTGAKNDDNITKNDKPSFVVPAPQEGETPVLLVDGKEVPADFDPNTNTLTPKQPIEPGKHKVTTAVKDPAGNVSDPSPELAIEIDKIAPNAPTTAPDITPETDTGAKNDDNITKNDKPSFVVPAPQEGETPVLLVDGKEVPAEFDPNTNTLTPKQPIEPGKHKVTTAVKDPAGNVSDPSPELAIEIDKTAPNAPTTAPDMTPETDTGAKNDDNITKNDKPSFVVPAPQEGETPVLLVDGKEVPADFDPNTNTLTPKQPIEPGKHKVTTAVKDPAGNVSDPSPELAIEIDKIAPNAPTTAPDMTPETDTGAKNDDNITKNDKPSFVVPAPQEGETPVLLVDGKEVPADFDPNTNTLTPKQPIEPGKHKVTTAVKDPAGNVSDPSPELAIEIDKTAPNAPTTAPDMTPETDTGAKNDDNITKNDKPSFVVPAPQEGETPVLLVDGKEVPADFDPNTNTLTPKQPIEPGKHKVTTAVKDPAGNVSDPSPELAIEIDKIAPNAPTTAPDMTPETDTGAKNDDNITKNDKPSFVVPAPQEGETPVLLVDGKEVPAEFDPNTNTLTPKQPIEPGKHKVTTAVKDPAGNVSDPSPELAIEIDKTAPNAPTTAPDMTPETDTGAKNDDNITKNDKPSFVVPAPQEGETPVLLVDGKEVPADFDPNTNTLTPKQPIEPGKHKVTTAVKDPAGNVSDPSPELAIEIDKIAPNAPTTAPDITPETDTGAKNDDNITKNDKPSFVVPAPQEGETPVLLVDGKEVPAEFDPNTNTLTPKQPIEPGKHKVTTAVKDPAGNVSDPSPELAIEIDKTAPNAPTTAPDMTPETDTGAKNDDNITKNDKPSFVVPAPQEGETPVLLVDGKEVPADFDPNTNTLTPKQPIEPGKHKVTTAVKDPAGNVSDPSPELAIEIDKIAPNAPTTAPDMTPETDTGAKNDDNITKNDKPSFVVPAPQEGETPVLLVDGKEVPADFDPNTNTLTPKQPIEPGKHKVTTAVKDPAGNVSDPSPELAIEIDKTAPNAPTTAPDMTPETDTGAKNDDNITKNDKPSFVVPAPQEGETPVLLVDGKEVPADFDPNTNTLTPKQPIEPGKHKVTTAVKDPAGNVSDPSPELAIEIDKIAPNAGTLSFNNLIDSGTTGDNITNDNNFDLALAGQETGSNVVYQVSKNGGTTWETTTANQANLADGTYQYRAVVTDAAGNTATTNTITQTIDKTPPKVTITMGDITANGTTAVKDVDTGSSHTLTFTFSEKVTDFTTKDITGSFGKFTDLNTTDEGKTWTATYTAPANIGNGQDAIILRNGVVTDVAGNANADGAEADNTFTVKLVEPTPPATLSIADAMITEGTRSDTVTTDTTMKFTVTRTGDTAGESSATWTVAHGTTTAEDFVGNLTGTVNFGAGETSKEISVTVKADNVVEKDETFTVTLSDPSAGTTITKETANGKITNDDKLTLQLESDTLGAGTAGTATDKITNDPTVNVLGLTEGQEWEYSIDGGEWQVGTGTSFELPDNTSIDGTGYTVKARLKEDTTQITESSTFTYDKVANAPVIAVVSANEVTGVAEAGALVTITDQLGKKLGSAIADATGSYTFNVDTPFVSGSVYKLNQLDKAGNQSISSEFNYVNLPRITKDWTDQSTGNIAITVGDSSGGIGNGNIYGIGTDVNTGDGNDSLYVKGQVFAAININMGGGDDYFRANYLSGTNGTEIDIDMGDGNDIFELTADIAGRSAYQSRILMGAGDDDARLSHYIASDWIDGGVGNDTLTFTNLFGKVADQDFSTIKGFETIDLTGTKDNILWNVNLATLEANGSETVLHIKGDKGDKVNLGASTSTAVNLNDSNGSTWSKIGEKTEDGVNYDVWHNSSSNNPLLDVYIQKDVTVI